MHLFQRDADGQIVPYAEWKVSTGREKLEINRERKVRRIVAVEPAAVEAGAGVKKIVLVQ